MRITSKVATTLVAGVALVLPMLAIAPTAHAGTGPPPCTKKAIKRAIANTGVNVTSINSKVCVMYYAAGSYTIDRMDDAAYLLTDVSGKWKVVGSRKTAKLCQPSDTTLDSRVKAAACVS